MDHRTDRTVSSVRVHNYNTPTLPTLLDPKDGWVGVDLDGCLADYTGFKGLDVIGEPLAPMVERVKKLLENGVEVRILTARVDLLHSPEELAISKAAIERWCLTYIGTILPVTCCKDRYMTVLYDDRAVRIVANKGTVAELK